MANNLKQVISDSKKALNERLEKSREDIKKALEEKGTPLKK